MLHNLLDTASNRRMLVMEVLLSFNGWVTSAQLATACHTSIRTINNDLQYLKQNYPDYFIIETSKQHGVRLLPNSSFRLESFYREVMNNNSVFNLMEGIFFHPDYTPQQWQDYLFLSSSSFYRAMNRITTSLHPYDITFDKKFESPNELNVRYFFSNFFTEKYGYMEWSFSFNRMRIIQALKEINYYIQQHLKDSQYLDLDSNQIMHAAMLIAVSIVRLSQGEYCQRFHNPFNFNLDQEIANEFYEKYKNIASPFIKELTFEQFQDIMYSVFAFLVTWKSHEEFEHINECIINFLDKIIANWKLHIPAEEFNRIRCLMLNIYSSYRLFPHDNRILYNQPRFIGNLIQESYPKLYQEFQKYLTTLAKETDFPWDLGTAEILFWLIVKWPEFTQLLYERYTKARILIVSDQGRDHQKYVAQSLNHIFGDFAETFECDSDIFELDKRISVLKEKYDLIVVTFDYVSSAKNVPRVLNINPILNANDFENIATELKEIRNENQLERKMKQIHLH